MGKRRSASPRWKAEGPHRSVPTATSATCTSPKETWNPPSGCWNRAWPSVGPLTPGTIYDRSRRGLGYAYALQGRLAEGRVVLEEAISDGIHTGALQDLAWKVAWLSEVCRLAGRGEEAWQHACQALDLARQHKGRADEALALHQLGVVQAHAHPPDVVQAEVH